MTGAQGVEAIRARWVVPQREDYSSNMAHSLALMSWSVARRNDAHTDIPLLLSALDEARAEVAEMSGWIEEHALIKTLARATAAESALASVRELADAYQRDVDNEQIDGDGAIVLGAVADDLKRLTTPTTTETGEGGA